MITSLFGAIPFVGDTLVTWLRGDYNVANATLQRFFALHVIGIPLLLLVLVFLHIVALHKVGSNNPEGIEIKKSGSSRHSFGRNSFSSLLHRKRRGGDNGISYFVFCHYLLHPGDGRLFSGTCQFCSCRPDGDTGSYCASLVYDAFLHHITSDSEQINRCYRNAFFYSSSLFHALAG